jgi:hypothetical protein
VCRPIMRFTRVRCFYVCFAHIDQYEICFFLTAPFCGRDSGCVTQTATLAPGTAAALPVMLRFVIPVKDARMADSKAVPKLTLT